MNKVVGQNLSEDKTKIVVTKYSTKYRSIPRRTLFTFVGLLVFFAVALCISLYIINDREKVNQTKVESFFQTNSCSENDLQSVRTEKASPEHIEASIYLLGFRASCLNRLGQYQQSLVAYKLLKSYYQMQHNSDMVTTTNSEINGVQLNINYASKNKTGSPHE
jgi:hypothetical protein